MPILTDVSADGYDHDQPNKSYIGLQSISHCYKEMAEQDKDRTNKPRVGLEGADQRQAVRIERLAQRGAVCVEAQIEFYDQQLCKHLEQPSLP